MFCILSCEETLFETDISDQGVSLLAPSDGATLDFTSVNFNWSAVQDADQYQFQIATPSFDNANQIVQDIILDSITQYEITLSPNVYQWRVKALNSAYSTQYSSANFQVLSNDNFPGNIVGLASPADNLVINSDTFTLEWNPILDATSYRIQIIDNETQLLVDEFITVNTSLEYTFAEGNYTWQVRAERNSEFTLYSACNFLIDTTLPNTPSLLTPENESTLTSEIVNFTWDRPLINGSVEIDSLYLYDDIGLTNLIEKQQISNSFETILNNNTSYYWLMKSFDSAGNESPESDVFSFTISQ